MSDYFGGETQTGAADWLSPRETQLLHQLRLTEIRAEVAEDRVVVLETRLEKKEQEIDLLESVVSALENHDE